MILFAILGVLFLGSLIITITHSYRPNTARSWLIAMITALIAWVASFVLRLYLPSEVNLLTWFPGTIFEEGLGFVVDYLNWPYMVAVLSMCVAALLTDTTRADPGITPNSWVQIISITSLNLLAILAANPLTMAIAWMITDLVELIMLLRLSKAAELGPKIIGLFGIRILSTFMLITATSIAWQGQPFSGFEVMQPNASLFFLIAAGLRLGVFPLNLPFLDSPELRWGVGTLFRLTPAASALVLIAHLPAGLLIFNQNLVNIVQVLTLLAAFYSSLMWLTRKTNYEARLYWMVTLSAFAIQSALNGHPEASRVWGLGLLLSGSLLFLFNPPIRRIRFLPLMGLLGFIGLPYTLAASGWEGLLPDTFSFTSVIMIITHAFLVLGYIRFIIGAGSTVTGLEKYARITFPLGLVTLIQTILVLGLVGWPNVLIVGHLLGSLGSLALVLIGLLIAWRFGFRVETDILSRKIPFYRLISTAFDFFRKALSLSWVSGLFRRVYNSTSGLAGFFSEILEGDGGILWSVVFLLALSILFLFPGF
jgi:hypothetical protein